MIKGQPNFHIQASAVLAAMYERDALSALESADAVLEHARSLEPVYAALTERIVMKVASGALTDVPRSRLVSAKMGEWVAVYLCAVELVVRYEAPVVEIAFTLLADGWRGSLGGLLESAERLSR